MADANKQLVRSLVDELFAGHRSAADEHPGYWPTLHTFDLLRSAFPDLSPDVRLQLAEGDIVVTHLELSGTHLGSFLGAEPTGQRFTWSVVYVDRLEGGRVVEHASGDGLLDVLIHLGVIPPPG